MKDGDRQSLFARVLNVLLFSLCALGSFVWFGASIITLVSELKNTPDVVTFNKGAMYMLGAGVGISFLCVGIVQRGIFNKKLSSKAEKLLIRGAVCGIAIMFILPHAVHFIVNGIVNREQYYNCEAASYRWLIYKKYVYTKDENVCYRLVSDKQAKAPSGKR